MYKDIIAEEMGSIVVSDGATGEEIVRRETGK